MSPFTLSELVAVQSSIALLHTHFRAVLAQKTSGLHNRLAGVRLHQLLLPSSIPSITSFSTFNINIVFRPHRLDFLTLCNLLSFIFFKRSRTPCNHPQTKHTTTRGPCADLYPCTTSKGLHPQPAVSRLTSPWRLLLLLQKTETHRFVLLPPLLVVSLSSKAACRILLRTIAIQAYQRNPHKICKATKSTRDLCTS